MEGSSKTTQAEESKQSSSGLEFKLHPVGSRARSPPQPCNRNGTADSDSESDYILLNNTLSISTLSSLVSICFCCGLFCQLVLVNIGDHHTRVKVNSDSRDQAPRTVLGCLLGAQSGREVDISNSFEIMYEMDGTSITVDWVFLQERLEQCVHISTVRSPLPNLPGICQCSKYSTVSDFPVVNDQRMTLGSELQSGLKLTERYGSLPDKSVFSSLDLVGWYSTGLTVGEQEIGIHRKVKYSSGFRIASMDLPIESL